MEPFVGQVIAFGFNFAPRGFAFCHGSILSIAQNTALFSLLGTIYGGDGRSTMGIPDLRGRAIVHPGSGPGLSPVREGEKRGVLRTQLSLANMPNHSHTGQLRLGTGTGDQHLGNGRHLAEIAGGDTIFTNAFLSTNKLAMDSVVIDSMGASATFDVREPYLAVNFCIALTGTYPSRN